MYMSFHAMQHLLLLFSGRAFPCFCVQQRTTAMSAHQQSNETVHHDWECHTWDASKGWSQLCMHTQGTLST